MRRILLIQDPFLVLTCSLLLRQDDEFIETASNVTDVTRTIMRYASPCRFPRSTVDLGCVLKHASYKSNHARDEVSRNKVYGISWKDGYLDTVMP
ncbi:hypothetical protein M0802_005631 [Mischocyttarus mexicanus]|nr:hypothetical protein M0802_005631 [Mischocyttarus mexicanus]